MARFAFGHPERPDFSLARVVPDDPAVMRRLFDAAGSDDPVRAERAADLLESLDDAAAESTEEQRDAYEEHYVRFLQRRGFEIETAPVPVVGEFFAIAARKAGWSAVSCRVRAVREAYRRRGLEDPTRDEIVRRILAEVRAGSRTRERDILPLYAEDYRRLRAATPTMRVRDLRDRTLQGIGFEAVLSSGQITALNVEDCAFLPQGLRLTVRRHGTARTVDIARRVEDDLVADVHEYFERAQITSGPVARAIDTAGRVGGWALSEANLRNSLKARVAVIGLDPRRYTWRSLPLGYIVSAKLKNVDELAIIHRAGFESALTLRSYDKYVTRARMAR